MSKEMIVSCSSHETKIAILEDDQVTELYFERGKEYSLAGSIYKGKVTRVLPGMQSAFVDIGLDRDAFLYVSDFLEDQEEYDKIASTVEEKVIRMEESAPVAEAAVAPVVAAPPPAEAAQSTGIQPPAAAEPSASKPESAPLERPAAGPARPFERGPQGGDSHQRFSRHSRRRRGHRKDFPESKYASKQPASPTVPASVSTPAPTPVEPPIILPGESLAKYKEWTAPKPAQPRAEEVERVAGQTTAEYPEASPGSPVEQMSVSESPPEKAEDAVFLSRRAGKAAGAEAPTIAGQVERNPEAWEAVSRQVAQAEEIAQEQIKLQKRAIEAAAEQRIERATEMP